MFCPECGKKLNQETIFCNGCGYKLTEEELVLLGGKGKEKEEHQNEGQQNVGQNFLKSESKEMKEDSEREMEEMKHLISENEKKLVEKDRVIASYLEEIHELKNENIKLKKENNRMKASWKEHELSIRKNFQQTMQGLEQAKVNFLSENNLERRCTNCGNSIKEGMGFCTKCGIKV